MSPVSIPIIMMAAVALYLGFYHLTFIKLQKEWKENTIFASVCFSVAFYDFAAAGLYSSTSIAQGVVWQKLQYVAINFLIIAFAWLIYQLSSYKKKPFYIALSLIAGIFIVLELLLFNSPLFINVDIPSIERIDILGRFEIVYYEAAKGVIATLQFLVEMTIACAMIFIVLSKREFRESYPLFTVSLFLFFLTSINDSLIPAKSYRFIYLMEYAFFLVMFALSALLLQKYENLYKKIEKLNVGLERRIEERTFELNAANEKLKSLDTLKNDFIANISHDFRSPLSGILNIADLALKFDQSLSKENRDNYDLIYRSAVKLNGSIDKILELARIEAQGIKLRVEKIDLQPFLDEMIDYYSSITVENSVRFVAEYKRTIPITIFTDREKLEQVLGNIYSNAVKFVHPATGLVKTGIHENSDTVDIVIEDNGIGIAEDRLESIFNRFERSDAGTARGSGIGLAFAKTLMDYLKGSIKAESEGDSQGSRFILTLKKGNKHFDFNDFAEGVEPKGAVDLAFGDRSRDEFEGLLAQRKPLELITERNEWDEFDKQKALILIAEDSRPMQKILLSYLVNNGYKNFVLVSNGKDALSQAHRFLPDLIISDYNMPLIHGDEFQEEILRTPDLSKVPFIFLSAYASEEVAYQFREKGAVDFIHKPVNERELIISVSQHLENYFEMKRALYLSTTDELTSLYTKRAFFKLYKSFFSGRKTPLCSLLFAKIDSFHRYCERYGYCACDTIVSQVASCISVQLRQGDIIGRYSRDTFVILLPDLESKETREVILKLQNALSKGDFTAELERVDPSLSFGFATLIDSQEELASRLGIASLDALYKTALMDASIEKRSIRSLKHKLAFALFSLAEQNLQLDKPAETIAERG